MSRSTAWRIVCQRTTHTCEWTRDRAKTRGMIHLTLLGLLVVDEVDRRACNSHDSEQRYEAEAWTRRRRRHLGDLSSGSTRTY